MRRLPGQALRLGVSADRIALAQTRRWGTQASVLAEQDVVDGRIAEAMRTLLADYAGWPLTIVLADELLRLWPVTPPQDAARLADLEAAAALRFQTLYGESAAVWIVRAAWDAGKPFLAAAMPRSLNSAIEQGASGLALVEVVPQFVAVYNRHHRALKADAWFAVLEENVLHVAVFAGQQVLAVRAAGVPPAADAAWLRQHVQREALRLNTSVPDKLQLWGALPAAWSADCTPLGNAPAASLAARLAISGVRA